MKKGYSKYALLLFIVAVVLKCVEQFVKNAFALSVGFYVALFLGLLMIAIETFTQKEFANAFCFDNGFRLDLFSYIAGVGFFVDFVSSAFQIYDVINTFSYNILVRVVPLVLECIFAVLSSACMVAIGLSFGKNSCYDFRSLKVFNIVPLAFFTSKGIAMLSQIGDVKAIDTVLMYMLFGLGILSFFFFAREVENSGGASNVSVFMFRAFNYVAVMYFFCIIMLVLNDHIKVVSFDFANAITYLFVGVFVYFLEKNILAHSILK